MTIVAEFQLEGPPQAVTPSSNFDCLTLPCALPPCAPRLCAAPPCSQRFGLPLHFGSSAVGQCGVEILISVVFAGKRTQSRPHLEVGIVGGSATR